MVLFIQKICDLDIDFRCIAKLAREITVEEIKLLVDDLGYSAKLAKRAGFDGIEIHACHGYFQHSFLSPRCNKRTDEYGGSFENRIRILLECIRSCRKTVGPDYVVGIRFSASEELPEGFDRLAASMLGVASVAFHDARRARVRVEDNVLVIGAGLIGQFAAQAARVKGARVTVIGDGSPVV